jgi:hypothetical protein
MHRVLCDRCGVEQVYFPSVEALQAANVAVPGLTGPKAEGWYQAYVARVEGLCEG